MEINKNAEAAESFLGRVKDKDGNEFTVKVISFKEPIARTEYHGDIMAGAFIESESIGTIFTMLFPEELSKENVQKQADYLINNIDTLFEEYKKNLKSQSNG